MSHSSNSTIHDDVRREHEELREMFGEIHRMVSKRAVSIKTVIASFNALRDQIEHHFKDEEMGGFFDTVCQQAPRLSDRSKAIRDEHAWLLVSIRNLHETAQDGDGSVEWWSELDKAFHQFSKDLMHHESKENELLQDAYNEDIAAAD